MPAARTSAFHGFTIEPARSKPVAVIDPAEASKVVGAIIRLNGRGSTSTDGAELTYAWSFTETPLGSTVTELTEVDDDGSVATFIPDVTGQYTVSLVVSTPYRSSDAATAIVEATTVLLPLSLRTTPDGKILFQVVSSFWKMVERNAVFSTLWSGYMQSTANDLLRAFQVDYGKSIQTIQEMFQRRWISYSPMLEIDSALCVGVYGRHQGGSGAFTASGVLAGVGIIVNDREVILLDGTPVASAIGSTLTIYTSDGSPGNLGEYTINRLNSDNSGYIVSVSVPFPTPLDDRLAALTTLVTVAGSKTVYDENLGQDFVALGVTAGDVLRLESGTDSGYYTVTAVNVGNVRTFTVDRAPTKTQASRAGSIFNAVRIAAAKTAAAATSTVFLPAAEADLSQFEARVLSGAGTLANAYEIVVEPRHVFSGMVGERLYLTSGSSSSGRSYTITGLNTAGTGYRVGASFGTATYPTSATYSFTSSADIADRLLILEDEAYEIVSATYDSGVDPEDGGRGEVWAVVISEARAPTGREGMSWRIAATISTTEFADFEELGVTAGDLLVLEATRTDTKFVGEIPCCILGAAGTKIAFDIGAALPALGAFGTLADTEILELAVGLKIPHVYEDASGVVQITLTAEEVQALVRSTAFQTAYSNVPITSSTVLDLDVYSVTLAVKKVIRNCRIPVDETLLSAPSLFEYIAEPTTGVNEDGEIILVTDYGTVTTLDRAPLELVENRDYTISAEGNTSGTNLVTTAGSAILEIAGGDLLDRDLRVGDFIDITSGLDQDRYYVSSVLDSTRMRALTADGGTPSTTASSLRYTITRRVEGNFIRFVDGMFTAETPAPDHLWAQLSLFDNNPTIEDNFGILVGVTKDQLDEYGSSQVSYRGAVRALMYAWASGPTIRNVTVGNHVLMGLPVTETRGSIIDIDVDYDTTTSTGRVLIEDLDAEGTATGLVRAYFYASSTVTGLANFQGLAINPETGDEFAVNDIVPAMTALSLAVLVDDYLTDPLWWKTSNSTGADELQKFHTWQVLVDASRVDSRDIPLITDFCLGIRPIYTKPKVVLVLYLYDDVTIEEQLTLAGDLFLYDDPVLSIESTHMVDSYNGSSLAQRIFDHGSLSTRTLFEGVDLVTTAGTGVVTSARGGFMGTLDETPLAHAPNEDVAILVGANTFFPEGIYYRGTPLVRSGDILFIREGVNRGRYTVVTVDSDTQITVAALEDYPPTTRPAAEIEASTAQVFQIQREDSHIIMEGADAEVLSNTGSGDDVTSIIEDAAGGFRWNGVAVGDLLVISDFAGAGVPGVYEILEVGTWLADDRVNLDTRLVVRGTLLIGDTFTYYVMRDGLRSNPLAEMVDLAFTTGSSVATSAASNFVFTYLRPGDQLEILEGTYTGQFFDIIDSPSDTTLYLRNFSAAGNETALIARVVRPSVFESDDPRDEDWELEKFCLSDDVSLVIIEPRLDVVGPLADLDLTLDTADPLPENWTATVTSATDLQVAGVVAGDKLSIDNANLNSGVFEIVSVAGTSAIIKGLWRDPEVPATGTFSTLNSVWNVNAYTVVLTTWPLAGIADLADVVVPGDILELPGVSGVYFVIAAAAGDTLTLTRDTNVNAMYTGRITRRSV
jgi:hypothetical protein